MTAADPPSAPRLFARALPAIPPAIPRPTEAAPSANGAPPPAPDPQPASPAGERSDPAADVEDDNGAPERAQPTAAIDRWIAVTFFRDYAATTKHEEIYSLRSLVERIKTVTAATKAKLPWLKLARFGELRSDKNSLRHDANVLAIAGIEADYDGGKVSFDEAVEALKKAGILCIIYTSPSHAPTAPRWRVLCPFSTELPPGQRSYMLARLNGLFGGIFAVESWTLSQSYYFGSLNHNPSHRVLLTEGEPIDQHDELDANALGKPAATPGGDGADGKFRSGPLDEAALREAIVKSDSYHVACVRLVGAWAQRGVAFMDAQRELLALFDDVFPGDRDARWGARRNDVPRIIYDIYGAEAKQRDAREGGAEPPPEWEAAHPGSETSRDNTDGWPEPVDILADRALGAPILAERHVPLALWPFIADTAERMGVATSSVALGSLVACSSVISEEWQLQPKRHDDTWTQAARLWGFIVGPPSIRKTPVISTVTVPIDQLEIVAREQWKEDMRAYKAALAEWKKSDESGPRPERPRIPRYMVEDTSTAALQEALRDEDDEDGQLYAPQGKVLVRRDELSEWLASLDQSSTNNGSDRGAYLRLYEGGRFTVDRIGRGSFATRSWSGCVLGGIQPEPIQRIARRAVDDGLLQRAMYDVPAASAPGGDRSPDRGALETYRTLFPGLAALRPQIPHRGLMTSVARRIVGGEPGRGTVVVLSAEAQEAREDIDALAVAMAAMPDTSPRLQAAFGKWSGLFARLCLTFHLVEIAAARARGDIGPPWQVVQGDTAQRVRSYMREVLLPHLLRAEALMFSTRQSEHAAWIAGYILAGKLERITASDIKRDYRALRAPEERATIASTMESLCLVGWLDAEQPRFPTNPPVAWRVNPAVHVRFAERAAAERARREAVKEAIARDFAARREAKARS